jgi:hypothetical protein
MMRDTYEYGNTLVMVNIWIDAVDANSIDLRIHKQRK